MARTPRNRAPGPEVSFDALRRAVQTLPRSPGIDLAAEVDKEALRRSDIFALRMAGVSVSELAKRYTTNASEIESIVAAEAEDLARNTKANPTAAIGLSVARTEKLLSVMWPMAEAGDVYAVDRVMRLIDRIDKLAGIEDPGKHEVGADEDLSKMTDADLKEYRRLKELATKPRKG